MGTGRLVVFLSRIVLRSKLLPLAVIGTLLIIGDSSGARLPANVLGFVVGSYSAALAALATGMLVATSGRFGEYCMSRIGCRRFALGLGVVSAIAGVAASLASLATEVAYLSATGKAMADPATVLVLAAYTGALMGYGYVLVAQLVRSSLPLLLLLVLVARFARSSGWVGALYLTPLLVALTGVALQIAVCSSPALKTRLMRGAMARWRPRLARSSGSYVSWRERRGVGSTTSQ